jgi:D-alanyl-D-alanine carboxypeptidase
MRNLFRLALVLGLTIGLAALFVVQLKMSSAQADDDISAQIDALMQSAYSADGAGAAIMVMQGEEVIVSNAYGLANLEWNIPATTQTSYRLGSISKPITAIAVLQLVQAGQVELDQPISVYLPDLQGAQGQPTIRQLLSHTSGLMDHFWLPQIPSIMRNPISASGITDLMAETSLMYDPGSHYTYSNFNYVLLGRLIEALDEQGRDFGAYVEQEIFAPLGMENSHYDRQAAIIPRRASGYDHNGEAVANTITAEISLAHAAGALMSSAEDMVRLTNALRTHSLLGPDIQELAWTATILPDGTDTGYGLGFNVSTFMGEAIIWHTGSTNGFQTVWIHMPRLDRTISILSNGYYLPNVTTSARRVLAVLAGTPVPDFVAEDFVDADWNGLEGRYLLEDGRMLQLHVQDGLRFNIDGDGWADLAWAGDNVFFWPDSLSNIRLLRDAEGEIDGLVYFTGSLVRHEGGRREGAIEGAKVSVAIDPDIARAQAGVWQMESGDSVIVGFEGDRMTVQVATQPPQQLLASADGSYFVRDAPTTLRFDLDTGTAQLGSWGGPLRLTRVE